jgi:hypothetical protein
VLVVFAATVVVSAACNDQYGTGPLSGVVVVADGGRAPSDDEEAGPVPSKCGDLDRHAAAPPPACNGDFGSGTSAACPVGSAICAPSGRCVSSCEGNPCAQGKGHDGPACDVIGFDGEDSSRRDARCGRACDAFTACPSGTFCDNGIGRFGGVCIAPLPSGTAFSIADFDFYKTCAQAGSIACAAGRAFGPDESHDFQGWCVCGARPGTACSTNDECSDRRCNADKKYGGLAGEVCVPLGAADVALFPETACRTSCSRATCACEPTCKTDADCGGPRSGRVCNALSTCVGGCRGADGNGCEAPMHCTSKGAAVGICTDGL